MKQPTFSFHANSSDAADKSGIAEWRYTIEERGEEHEKIVRQRFDTFDAAHAINALLTVAYSFGQRRGELRVAEELEHAIRKYLC